MNILLLGSGGREHALSWKLAQSPSLTKLYAAPGNPGIAEEAELVALDVTDHAAVIGFCESHRIALVVIGPEAPLVDGLSDSLRAAGVPVFGPSRAAAQLEGSKGFTKDLCARAGIPTAGYVRTASLEEARAALARFAPPYVLKADGLAAGKGVVIADTLAEAEAALADMFGGAFGGAGAEVVIEEFMAGEEASFFALTDGTAIIPFGSAQDHKRVGDGDVGPNTGGMGAYSPAPVLTEALQARVMAEIIEPTAATMRADQEAIMQLESMLENNPHQLKVHLKVCHLFLIESQASLLPMMLPSPFWICPKCYSLLSASAVHRPASQLSAASAP